MKHKWYKEIQAWAGGAEIEAKEKVFGEWLSINDVPNWNEERLEFRIKPQPKCTVKNCQNHVNEGKFIGDLCVPCWDYLTNGKGIHSQAYRNAQPKQPKYLYAYIFNGTAMLTETKAGAASGGRYIGKIEVQDD